MASKLAKWGNSLGVRLPQYIAERAGLAAGDYLYISLHDNEIVIRAVKARKVSDGNRSTESDKDVAPPVADPQVW